MNKITSKYTSPTSSYRTLVASSITPIKPTSSTSLSTQGENEMLVESSDIFNDREGEEERDEKEESADASAMFISASREEFSRILRLNDDSGCFCCSWTN